MNQTLCILFFSLFYVSSFGQRLEKYKDLIDIGDEFKNIKSNIEEVNSQNLSNFWINNEVERRFGFIGSNYRRLRIRLLSVVKNEGNPNQYLVYGKSKVSENVCEFQGIIEIMESYYIKSYEYSRGNFGILGGEYTFYEDLKTKHSGVFKGRFATCWYKDTEGLIKYSELAAIQGNNQFAGSWTEYGKTNKMTANWGDSRISKSGDLDIGTSEFGINRKYQANGWDYKPEKGKVAYGESSMWGDYHAMELAVYLQRLIEQKPYLTFY